MKRYIVGLAVAVAAIGTTAFSVAASAAPKADTILIGISAAKTGILGPYDLQAGQLFQMRIEQLNKAGGVLGQQMKVKWIDTKSDKPTAATNASELISQGAVAILTTCDFDFSFPATQAAGSKKVLGLSLCASSPKAATPAIVSEYGGSMGLGSDTEGTAMAEWFRAHKPALKRAWIVKDLSLEYSKATADYFKARWKQLGGTVCGEDTFTAGDNLDLSSNVTRLRGAVSKCDVIYDGSWNPFGAQYVRAVRDAGIKTTIITNASVNGLPVVQNNPGLSNFYALGFACLNTYCKGSKNPAVAKVNAEFKKKYGQPIGNHYALPGYELADALVAAIKKAGSTDGTKISQALYASGLPIKTFAGNMAFTAKCHRPQPALYTVEQYTGGKDKQIDSTAVKKIPNIGDGSPCSGVQPKVKS
jgi:branched-chain amino acid transport system substrate-binding protein